MAFASTPLSGQEWMAAPKWTTAGSVAMLAWHFGHEMRNRLGVHIGIIISAIGGTCIEQWKPGPDAGIAHAGPGGIRTGAGGLYDKLILPIQPYRIKGVVWWQGESNADNAEDYYEKFVSLIRVWRQAWGQGDFPFLWVQLQRIVREGTDWWVRIADGRSTIADAQRRALSEPNCAMAVSYDVTDGDLHPPDAEKKRIAERLALATESTAYGAKVEGSGPLPAAVVRRGGELVVSFASTAEGLEVRDNLTISSPNLEGFELQAAGMPFFPATARIEGVSVVVPVAGLTSPFVVRYAWGPQPKANLYNRAGLPAPTFITEEIQ